MRIWIDLTLIYTLIQSRINLLNCPMTVGWRPVARISKGGGGGLIGGKSGPLYYTLWSLWPKGGSSDPPATGLKQLSEVLISVLVGLPSDNSTLFSYCPYYTLGTIKDASSDLYQSRLTYKPKQFPQIVSVRL